MSDTWESFIESELSDIDVAKIEAEEGGGQRSATHQGLIDAAVERNCTSEELAVFKVNLEGDVSDETFWHTQAEGYKCARKRWDWLSNNRDAIRKECHDVMASDSDVDVMPPLMLQSEETMRVLDTLGFFLKAHEKIRAIDKTNKDAIHRLWHEIQAITMGLASQRLGFVFKFTDNDDGSCDADCYIVDVVTGKAFNW